MYETWSGWNWTVLNNPIMNVFGVESGLWRRGGGGGREKGRLGFGLFVGGWTLCKMEEEMEMASETPSLWKMKLFFSVDHRHDVFYVRIPFLHSYRGI